MRAALELALLTMRRAGTPRAAALAILLGVPALAAAFMAVASAPGDSPMALKVRPMLHGTGWEAYLGLVGQLFSVGLLLGVGVVVSWSFGREHTDGTFGSLFALPTSLRQIALAKFAVLIGWALLVSAGAVLIAVAVGPFVGAGPLGVAVLPPAGRALAVAGLTIALTTPLALVASAARGYLPAVGVLIGIVVVTQVTTVAGAGAWFPYAAPSLWAGMGGAALADAVTGPQLLTVLPVLVLGVAGTLRWWDRAEVS